MIDLTAARRKAHTASQLSSSERSALRRAATSLVLTGAILVCGSLGYYVIDDGKHPVIDCLFMTFITITTIGYEETIPLLTPASKIFTMILGVAGVANLAFFTSATFAWIVELETNPTRRRRNMEKRIEKLSGHFIVCGMGRAGARICEELLSKGVPFVAIDTDDAKIDEHPLHVKGDASDDDVLAAANIHQCAGVFAVTGDDAKNLMITLAARDLAPKCRIVARASDERNAKRMTKSGANATICPDIAAGLKLASAMLTPHAHGFIDELSIGGNASLVEASIDEVDAGQTLHKFIAARHDLAAVALYRGEAWSVNPKPEVVLALGDVLIMLSTPSK